MTTVFSGSYAPEEVQFLLQLINLPDTPVALKEQLIQSGQRHYAHLLTHETAPAADYVALFDQSVAMNSPLMAKHLLQLAAQIVATPRTEITLVSLARAGTPIGVLLRHILAHYYQRSATHYSISIFRGIGLDLQALRYLLQKHAANSIVWLDGWTGKGGIARQLASSLQSFAVSDGIVIAPDLYVLTDLSGSAHFSASTEDYLIPTSVLNATVSGLVSRSVFVDEHSWHGCLYYQHLQDYDLSNYFVSYMQNMIAEVWQAQGEAMAAAKVSTTTGQQQAHQFLHWVQTSYAITETRYIKLGIGESTRALLRREVGYLLLNDASHAGVQHLLWLAETKAVPVVIIKDMPYRATALVKRKDE